MRRLGILLGADFVATPYDIPTTNPVTPPSDTDDSEGSGAATDGAGGSSMGGEGVFGEGGGDSLVSQAGPALGAKCTLVPTDSTKTIPLALDLWWLLFAGAAIAALRPVTIRLRSRR